MKRKQPTTRRQVGRTVSWTRPLLLAGVLSLLIIGLIWQWTKRLPRIPHIPALVRTERNPQPSPLELSQSVTSDGKSTAWMIRYPARWSIADQPAAESAGVERIITSKVITNYRPGQADKDGIPNDAVRIVITVTAGGNGRTIDSLLDCGGKTMTCTTETINGHPFKKSTAILNVGTATVAAAAISGDDIYRIVATISPGANQEYNIATVERIVGSISLEK